MVQAREFRRRPDQWVEHPSLDPRLEYMADLIDGLLAVIDFASGRTTDDPCLHPMELAGCFRQAAATLERWTDTSLPVD